MDATTIRAVQAPLKARYRDNPSSALATLAVEGQLGTDEITCRVDATVGTSAAEAGLHPFAGGNGEFACSGDMLLQALVGCAGVTLCAVATAMSIPLRGGRVRAEGDLDFRGTLGIAKDVPVGFAAIRLHYDLETDAPAEKIATLVELAERHCVVYQTLKTATALTTTHRP
jgi:uncharacterized OsmC-like protein